VRVLLSANQISHFRFGGFRKPHESESDCPAFTPETWTEMRGSSEDVLIRLKPAKALRPNLNCENSQQPNYMKILIQTPAFENIADVPSREKMKKAAVRA
jgi:hypothetical protein